MGIISQQLIPAMVLRSNNVDLVGLYRIINKYLRKKLVT